MRYTSPQSYLAFIKAAGRPLSSLILIVNLIPGLVVASDIEPGLKKNPVLLRSGLADDPGKAFTLAKTAAEQGDYNKAIDLLENILQKNPELANIRLELGLK